VSIRNSRALTFQPSGVCDAVDGTNVPPGAMRLLTNLIPAPENDRIFVCRPGAVIVINFTTGGFSSPGFVSGMLVVGDLVFGTIATARNSGKDEPWCFNMATMQFLTVAGVTNANSPTSPPSSGAWTPPILAQVASRIIVTHPGFPGGTVKFGWFDVSGFTELTQGNTHTTTTIDGNPSILGIQPGMAITGSNIAANTSVVTTSAFVLNTSGQVAFDSPLIDLLEDFTGIAVGQTVQGLGIAFGSTVASITLTPIVTTGDTHSTIELDAIPYLLTLTVGQTITGTGIPAGARIAQVTTSDQFIAGSSDSTTTITLRDGDPVNLVAYPFVSGQGIPANTRVQSATRFSLVTAGDIVAGSFIVTNLVSTTGVKAGQNVSGFGVDLQQVVVSVDSPTQVTLSQPASQTVVASEITFSSVDVVISNASTVTAAFINFRFQGTRVIMNKAATATATGVTLTFTAFSLLMDRISLAGQTGRTNLTFTGATITLSQAATGSADQQNLIVAGGTSTKPFSLPTTGDTHSNTTLDNLASIAGVRVGDTISDGAVAIPAGTAVSSIDSATQVTMSQAATGTLVAHAVTFSNSVISPLWGAGDCDRNPLLSVPLGVAQMNGRAYFADGLDGIPWSDSGLPCRRSNSLGVQALTTNDGLSVTAIAPLMLSAPLTGGIVQALIAFESATKMQQITGDEVTGNLRMNVLPVATGTEAPLSISPADSGTFFVSPHGMRRINFDGTVSKVIGDAGRGITQPFINAHEQSRICAAANADVYRVTTQNHLADHAYQEYWFDLTRQIFTGPHTSTASLIQPWRGTFLMSFVGETGTIYRSDPEPLGDADPTFIERNAQLSWAYRTSLLPDSGDLSMVALNETTLACSLTEDAISNLAMISDFGEVLARASVTGEATATLWNQFNWNEAIWNGSGVIYRQRLVAWPKPLVFKQGSLLAEGQSDANVRVGNLYMRYQRLGYIVRRLLPAIGFALFAGAAHAACTLPFTITPATLADAAAVMANFNALNACANLPFSWSQAFPSVGGSTPADIVKLNIGSYALADEIPAGVVQGIVSSMVVPNTFTETPWPSTTFSAYLRNGNSASGNSSVGYFASLGTSVDGASNYGVNAVLSNTDKPVSSVSNAGLGHDFGQLNGIELDFNIMKKGAGTPSGSLFGLQFTGASEVAPALALAIDILPLDGTSIPWTTAIQVRDSAAVNFASVGSTGPAPNSASQQFAFQSWDASVRRTSSMYTDTSGDFHFRLAQNTIAAIVEGPTGLPIFYALGTTAPANYIETVAGGTGVDPVIFATGSDTNVGLTLRTKGSSGIFLDSFPYANCTTLKTVAGALVCVP